MLEILIGLIAGIISGLGMGGGTVLILFLTLFANIEQHIAQATNVIFFIPTAIAAIFIFIKNRKIDYKLGIPICFCGIIGAILGANLSSNMEVGTLRKVFGIFLIFVAIYELYSYIKTYIKEKNRDTTIK